MKKIITLLFLIFIQNMNSQIVSNPNRPEAMERYFQFDYRFNPQAEINFPEILRKDNIQNQIATLSVALKSSNTFKHTFASAEIFSLPLTGSGNGISDLANFGAYVQEPTNGINNTNLQIGIFGEGGYQELTAIGPINFSRGVIGTIFNVKTVLSHILGHMVGVNSTHNNAPLVNMDSFVNHGAGFTDLEEINSLGFNSGPFGPIFTVEISDANVESDGFHYFQTLADNFPARISQTEMSNTGESTSLKINNFITTYAGKWQTRTKATPITPIATLSSVAEGENDISISNGSLVNDNVFFSIIGDNSYSVPHEDILLYLYLSSNTTNNMFVSGPIDVNDTFTDLENGEYVIMGYSPTTNQRTLTSNIVVIDSSLSVSTQEINGLIIYPNPTTDFITISNLYKTEIIIIFNSLGQKVREIKIQNNENIDVSKLNKGVYYLKIGNRKGVKFIKK